MIEDHDGIGRGRAKFQRQLEIVQEAQIAIRKLEVEVRRAMQTIRDERLYWFDYRNWDECCRAEFGHTRHRFNRLLRHDEIVEEVSA